MGRKGRKVVPAEVPADKAALVMRIAVEHAAVSSDPRVLCAAAHTCKGWREAVQQCSARNTEVVLSQTAPLQQLDSLAGWLAKHASLLKSVAVSRLGLGRGIPWLEQEGHFAEVRQSLQHAIQAAAAAAAGLAAVPAAGGPAANGAPAMPQQQQQGLRRVSFSCDLPGATAMLAALPAHTLTHLHLECSDSRDQAAEPTALNEPALAAALAQLSSLQQLRLDNLCSAPSVLAALPVHSLNSLELLYDKWPTRFPNKASMQENLGSGEAFAAALGKLRSLRQLRLGNTGHWQHNLELPGDRLAGVLQLSQLTSLTLEGSWSDIGQPLAQLLERPPPLQRLQLKLSCEPLPVLNMAALTQLESLAVAGPADMLEGAVMPAQLVQLHYGNIKSGSSLSVLMGLQQLQHLSLDLGRMAAGSHDLLLRLQQLPALRHLTLQYRAPTAAAASAPVWAKLPQLHALHFLFSRSSFEPDKHERAAITSGIKAASSLSQVLLDASRHPRWAEKAAVYCRQAGLSRTSRLDDPVVQGDLHLLDDFSGCSAIAVMEAVVYERP
uniref:F-box domain-containing protein n=1 Tax=Tetradesmus obliquus TaxID=3088 RepID=A0A383W3F1_TETOB|eukprot:jgi/Sobl393_1/15571/SZX71703.1